MSRLLAWSVGASCGYVVGWLAGSNVVKLAEGRRLGRPVPPVRPVASRTPVPAPRKPLEAGNGAEEGTWPLDMAALHARPDYQEALRRAEGMPWEPGVDLTAWMAERGLLHPLDEVAAEFGVDLHAPCTVRSPGGGIVCCRTGDHTSHLFEGSHARDRKDDADERIE